MQCQKLVRIPVVLRELRSYAHYPCTPVPMCPIPPVPHCPLWLHYPCAPYPLYPISPCVSIAHVAHCSMGTGVMGHMGNGAQGQWGTGVWQWGTWTMGYIRYGAHGQWGHMGNGGTWAMGYRGYGVQGVWATPNLSIIKEHNTLVTCHMYPLTPTLIPQLWWAEMVSVMCQNVKGCQVVKKMSNVKKSNTWTIYKVHKKINWHNEVHRYWHQFWHHIWWSLRTLKMSIESTFGQFWWPRERKLTITRYERKNY